MARLYSQLCTAIFLIVGVGGIFLGDASTVRNGHPGGNLGSLSLQLTWSRDVLDIALAMLFGYVGFVAGRRTGRLLVFGAGAVLLLLALLGFVRQSSGLGPIHLPRAMNIFDLVIGLLAVLSALGTIDDPGPLPSR